MHQLDVDVLVERPRQTLTRGGKDAPPRSIVRHEPQGPVFGRIAEPKHRNRLEPHVEEGGARRSSAAGDDGHVEKVDLHLGPGKLPRAQPEDLAGNPA